MEKNRLKIWNDVLNVLHIIDFFAWTEIIGSLNNSPLDILHKNL